MSETDKVLVPIWVLKTKVEGDWEEYKYSLYGELAGDMSAIDWDDAQDFPIYDSTLEIVQILEEQGIRFNKVTGDWE